MPDVDADSVPSTDPLHTAARQLREELAEHRLIGIIRGTDPDACVATATVLVDEGVQLLEVSLTTTAAEQVIERIATTLHGRVRLGVGTAMTKTDVRRAHDAGASFVLTPGDGPGLREAARRGLPAIPGALTPSEVYAAANAPGTAAVKLFPASSQPPSYLAALRDPFPTIGLVPVGGVGLSDVPAYLRHGAVAVGVGSPLCGDAPHGGDLDALRLRARDFLAATRTVAS